MSTPLGPGSGEEEAFARLKRRLAQLWKDAHSAEDAPHTSVVVPSVSLEREHLERHPEALHYEEALLFVLIRLRNPRAGIVYLTSRPIPPPVLDYYLQFLAGIPSSHARQRLTLLSAHDGSLRPLTEKILERPRLLRKIRDAVPDPEQAYITVFRSTNLEKRLALALDLPLNAAEPENESVSSKSEARRILRSCGIELPYGFENVRGAEEVRAAFFALRRRGAQRAVVKLERAFWDEGHGLVDLRSDESASDPHRALKTLRLPARTWTRRDFVAELWRHGGVIEEFLDAPDRRTASVQVRIDPAGRVSLSSTHDEMRSGADDTMTAGCRFPADDAYRSSIQAAGLAVGSRLAEAGLVSRVSIEFVMTKDGPGGAWRARGSGLNLGVGGATHPLLAVRFLTGGRLDSQTGLFHSPSGRQKFYRATDAVRSECCKGLTPEDIVETLTMRELNYSHHSESGALCTMLGAASEFGRLGVIAVGNSRDEAEAVFARTVAALEVTAAPTGGRTGGESGDLRS